jgi:hypothetical protein
MLGVQSGTLGAARMTVHGADNELGTAVTAGRSSFQLNYGVGCQHRWAPKFMLSLIDGFCHKKLFSFFCLLNASQSPNESIVNIADSADY